ncbi:Cytosolic endo-beta-N-acetylglucosaminidase 2 [Nymphon striatum]|nr:Cytosolic endo-beta-N-acetylglucosaminidase 2 [Nymphon striatum]
MEGKECIPLKNLKDTYNWKNVLTIHDNVTEFQSKLESNSNRSKRLLCHDMAGGTLITEWDDGAEICKHFLKDVEAYTKLADALVEIAFSLKFDGWLINIENPIQENQIENLVDFVKILTEKMHVKIEHSTVIWYDSVTKEGKLTWQNELNEMNRCFFDICDGIFVNYTWNVNNLDKCVEEAGPRLHDVYIGVDVFGRNFYGGGGYSTDLAMVEISNKDLSSAIFAPGWVHEVCGAENFTRNENSSRFSWHTEIKLSQIQNSCNRYMVNSKFQDSQGCRFELFKVNHICEKNLCIAYAMKDLEQNETIVNPIVCLWKHNSPEQITLDSSCTKVNNSYHETGWVIR